MNSPIDYPDEQSAARGLLGEVAQTLNSQDVNYVVIGGWVPYLFNSRPISHPGTFDVDVLLDESTPKAKLELAVNAALRSGYLRAPKNQFQLHRLLNVQGEPLVFHVDFLHRKYADDTNVLLRHWGKVQSIAGPGTDVIFTENERTVEPVAVRLPNGRELSVSVPFCSEAGFLSAKGRSATVPKRTRDAFDIFLVIRQSRDFEHLMTRCRHLMNNGVFRASLENLREGFSDGKLLLQAAAHLHDQAPSMDDPEGAVKACVTEFFDRLSARQTGG